MRKKLIKNVYALGTRILIFGGGSSQGEVVSTVYIADVHFKPNSAQVSMISYESLPKIPSPCIESFACSSDGRYVVGGGRDKKYKATNRVFEFESNELKWKRLPSLNIARFRAAATYFHGVLYVTGGYNYNNDVLDSIEILDISRSDNRPKWKICQSTLPIPITDHTISVVNGKFILIGGSCGGRGTFLDPMFLMMFKGIKEFLFYV